MAHDKFFALNMLNLFRVAEEELTAKIGGRIWRAHKNDKDTWPSNPHAHDIETGDKLNLETGDIWDIRRGLVGRLTKKELAEVRRELHVVR